MWTRPTYLQPTSSFPHPEPSGQPAVSGRGAGQLESQSHQSDAALSRVGKPVGASLPPFLHPVAVANRRKRKASAGGRCLKSTAGQEGR